MKKIKCFIIIGLLIVSANILCGCSNGKTEQTLISKYSSIECDKEYLTKKEGYTALFELSYDCFDCAHSSDWYGELEEEEKQLEEEYLDMMEIIIDNFQFGMENFDKEDIKMLIRDNSRWFAKEASWSVYYMEESEESPCYEDVISCIDCYADDLRDDEIDLAKFYIEMLQEVYPEVFAEGLDEFLEEVTSFGNVEMKRNYLRRAEESFEELGISEQYQDFITLVKNELDGAENEMSEIKPHTCEVCNRKGEYTIVGFSGATEYYCTSHYIELQEMMEDMFD